MASPLLQENQHRFSGNIAYGNDMLSTSGTAPSVTKGSLRELADAFTARSDELVLLAALKVDDRTRSLFVDNVDELEAVVSELESTLSAIQAVVAQEKEALPRAAALLGACRAQSTKVLHVKENLPPYFSGDQKLRGSLSEPSGKEDAVSGADTAVAEPKAQPGNRKGPRTLGVSTSAPRNFVTLTELGSAPGYMRGRLTLDKVNAAIEELAKHAESVSKASMQKSKTKQPFGKQVTAMWQRLQPDQKQALKGKHWLMESCFRDGTHLKPDKSSRSLLTLLRHLGRLQEMRVTKGGAMTTIYILLE